MIKDKTQRLALQQLIRESCPVIGTDQDSSGTLLITPESHAFENLKDYSILDLDNAGFDMGKTIFYLTPCNKYVTLGRTGSTSIEDLLSHIRQQNQPAEEAPTVKVMTGIHGWGEGIVVKEYHEGETATLNQEPIDDADVETMIGFYHLDQEITDNLTKGKYWPIPNKGPNRAKFPVPYWTGENLECVNCYDPGATKDTVAGANPEKILNYAYTHSGTGTNNFVILSWCYSIASHFALKYPAEKHFMDLDNINNFRNIKGREYKEPDEWVPRDLLSQFLSDTFRERTLQEAVEDWSDGGIGNNLYEIDLDAPLPNNVTNQGTTHSIDISSSVEHAVTKLAKEVAKIQDRIRVIEMNGSKKQAKKQPRKQPKKETGDRTEYWV